MADPRELSTAELVARGLLNPGPLAPAITSKDPEVNAQAIREFVNPALNAFNPITVFGKAHRAAGEGLGAVAGALGGLNLGGAMLSPEQKALRSRQLGNQFRDMGEAMLLPAASAGRVIGPLAQSARPLFTAFLTRLGLMGGLAGLQKAMESRDPGAIFGQAAMGAALGGAALQAGMEAPAKIVRFVMASQAGRRILAAAAAQFKTSLGSFQARQQFDKEFVGQLNELRAQGFKEEAAQTSREYGQRAFEHKVAGQKMTVDWEKQVAAQEAVKEAARTAHMDQVAQRLAVDWDARVPAWKGMPATVEGLVDRVYGQGQAKLSAAFDTSLKEIAAKAQGKLLTMPLDQVEALGVQGGVRQLAAGGAAEVDAAEVAKAVLGKKSQIDPELYHAAAGLLTGAGLGNAQANAEYAAGMALKKFVDKTQALEFIGTPTLYPERLLKGLTQEPQLKQLQGRLPEEDALRGSVAAAREGLPPTLPDIPRPVQGPLGPRPVKGPEPLPMKTDPQLDPSRAPVEPTPEDLGVSMTPLPPAWKMGALGGALGGAAGGPLGGGSGHYGVGGMVGTAGGLFLSHLLGNKFAAGIPKGPLTPTADAVLARAPTIAAGIVRAIAGGGEVTPEDLAEIRAAQAAGQTATNRPDLSLEIDPSELR